MPRRAAEAPELEQLLSLTVLDACLRTGWSKSHVYRELSSGRLKSYTLGRRRYIDAASLRELIAGLLANSEIKPEPRFHNRHGLQDGRQPATAGRSSRKPRA